MRAVVQRVARASVTIDGEVTGRIGAGYVVLLGVGQGDTRAQADTLWGKLRGLRINEDDAGKTNLSLADVDGEVLVVDKDNEDFVENPEVLERICARLDALKASEKR